MWEKQEGKCAICGALGVLVGSDNESGMVLDHDHATGVVRGLVCRSCNAGLGAFKDNVAAMQKAAVYLTEERSIEIPETAPKPKTVLHPVQAPQRVSPRLTNSSARFFLSLVLSRSIETSLTSPEFAIRPERGEQPVQH